MGLKKREWGEGPDIADRGSIDQNSSEEDKYDILCQGMIMGLRKRARGAGKQSFVACNVISKVIVLQLWPRDVDRVGLEGRKKGGYIMQGVD